MFIHFLVEHDKSWYIFIYIYVIFSKHWKATTRNSQKGISASHSHTPLISFITHFRVFDCLSRMKQIRTNEQTNKKCVYYTHKRSGSLNYLWAWCLFEATETVENNYLFIRRNIVINMMNWTWFVFFAFIFSKSHSHWHGLELLFFFNVSKYK